jgi:hypothetical protein
MQLTDILKRFICGLPFVSKVVSRYLETSKLGKGYREIVKLSEKGSAKMASRGQNIVLDGGLPAKEL